MNTTPVASTSRSANASLLSESEPAAPIAAHLTAIDNSSAILSSFEIKLQQTFTCEILVEILRRLPAPRQVGHPWQHLLPEKYSRLLDCSAVMTNTENAQTLLKKLSEIPHAWQHDAINAIGENFIKRIQHFDPLTVFIDFIILNHTSGRYALGLLILYLIDRVGKLDAVDRTFQSDKPLLPEDIAACGQDHRCIIRALDSLNIEERRVHFDNQLQHAKNHLFFHNVRTIHWNIKTTCGEQYNNEQAPLQPKVQHASLLAKKKIEDLIIKINQKREMLHSAHHDAGFMDPDTRGSHKKTRNVVMAINEKIKIFNANKRHHAALINRHTFEILSALIAENSERLPCDLRKKVLSNLTNSIGNLSEQQRHIALHTLIRSKNCTIPVLTVLVSTVSDQFYKYPYDAMRLIADEIEIQHKNNEDVSPIIAAINKMNKEESTHSHWRNINYLSVGCQKLLRGTSRH